MANMYGGDSKYLISNRNWNKNWVYYCLFLLFLCLIVYWLLQAYVKLAFLPSISISFGVLVLFSILNKITDSFYFPFLNFKKGIIGESIVRAELKRLPNEYTVFQDIKIPTMKGNIDFVVIGPTGIFTIEVKSWGGKIEFEGKEITSNGRIKEKGILQQAKGEAFNLHQYLKEQLNIEIGFIYPLIVFGGKADIHFGLTLIDNAYIIQKSYLLEVLTKRTSGDFDPKNRILIENKIAELIDKK